MSRLIDLMILSQRYPGSKGSQVTRQEDGSLGNLATPGYREESASHHYHDPQCASAQRTVLKNVILSEGEVIFMANLAKHDIVKIMIFHSSWKLSWIIQEHLETFQDISNDSWTLFECFLMSFENIDFFDPQNLPKHAGFSKVPVKMERRREYHSKDHQT